MSEKQFLKELRKLRMLPWKVNAQDIRCAGMCPIEAVAAIKLGRKVGYTVGARKLGLSVDVRDRIIRAADHKGVPRRKALLRALKLNDDCVPSLDPLGITSNG